MAPVVNWGHSVFWTYEMSYFAFWIVVVFLLGLTEYTGAFDQIKPRLLFAIVVVLTAISTLPFLYFTVVIAIDQPWRATGYDMGASGLAFGYLCCSFVPFAITIGLWCYYFKTH